MKNFHGDFNFIGLITNLYSIIHIKSEKEYLDMLLGLSEKEIITSIVYSIISDNENSLEYSKEIMSKAETLSLNKTKLISLIKDLPTEQLQNGICF